MPHHLDVDPLVERPTLTLNTRAAEVAANTRRLAELEADPKCRSPGPLLILQQPSIHDPSEVTIKTALFHGQLVPMTIQPSLVPSPCDPNRPPLPPMHLPTVGQYSHGWPLQAIEVPPASPNRPMRRINLYLNWPGYGLHDVFSVFMVDVNPNRAILDVYEHLSHTFAKTMQAWAQAPSDPKSDWTGKWRLTGIDTEKWVRHLVLVELVEVWPDMWSPIFRMNILS